MSESQTTENVEALKAKVAELEAENEKLKQSITEATETSATYVEKKKEAARAVLRGLI
jgi:prefoldin subunit 5